jgi:hypothetical protein
LGAAELVVGLCERFGKLPRDGGILDQPVTFLKMLRIVSLAREEDHG